MLTIFFRLIEVREIVLICNVCRYGEGLLADCCKELEYWSREEWDRRVGSLLCGTTKRLGLFIIF